MIYKLLGFTFAMIVGPIGSYFLTVDTVFRGMALFLLSPSSPASHLFLKVLLKIHIYNLSTSLDTYVDEEMAREDSVELYELEMKNQSMAKPATLNP